MDFVSLVKRLDSELNLGVTTSLSTATAAGEPLRLVNWINDAWREVQTSNDGWFFLRAKDETLTTTGKSIDAPDDFSQPIALVLVDGWQKTELSYLDLDDFNDKHRTTTDRTQKPQEFTIESGAIVFDVTPDDNYSLSLEYVKTPQELSANTDTPIMPAQYHMMLVYKAMEYYGYFEVAQEYITRGELGFKKLSAEMAVHNKPRITAPAALA